MSAAPEYYYGVICVDCGPVQLNGEQYREEMQQPDSRWTCPKCHGRASWDDARYGASCEAVYAHHMQNMYGEVQPLDTPRTVAGLLSSTKEAVPLSKLLGMDFGELELRIHAGLGCAKVGGELTVICAGTAGRWTGKAENVTNLPRSLLGYKPEPDA